MSQQFGGGWGDIVASGAFVQTPEVVTPTPGVTVAMCRQYGTDAAQACLSSTGQTVSPNSFGVILVPIREAATLRSAGWTEYVYPSFTKPSGPIPVGTLSTLYSTAPGWSPRAEVVSGVLSLLSTAPAGTSIAGVAMALVINTPGGATLATGTTDATGNYSLSTATLPTNNPVVKTVLAIQAAGAAVATTSVMQ